MIPGSAIYQRLLSIAPGRGDGRRKFVIETQEEGDAAVRVSKD